MTNLSVLTIIPVVALLSTVPEQFCSPVHAQDVRTEHLVALDSQGTLEEITGTLRRQLDLVPDIENFQRARLFRGTDGLHVLEIEYLADLVPVRQRRHLTAAAVDSLRRTIDNLQGLRAKQDSLDHSGRGEFIFDQIVLSLLLYGPAAPVLLDVPGSRSALAAYMLTSSAGFYIPYRLTQHIDVTHSHRHLAQYGSTRGIAYGLLLKHMLTGDGGVRRTAAFITGTSITSGFAGFAAADWRRYSRGQAELYGVMGDFGLLTGVGLAFTLDLYNEDEFHRTGDLVSLMGAGAGLYAGELLGRRHSYTRGDAYALRAGGVLGTIVALPVVNASGTNSDRLHMAGALAGELAGISFTHSMLAEKNLTLGEGLIITGGELAGLMLGLGLTYLVDTDGNFDDLAYFSSAAVGSLAGFSLTFRLFD